MEPWKTQKKIRQKKIVFILNKDVKENFVNNDDQTRERTEKNINKNKSEIKKEAIIHKANEELNKELKEKEAIIHKANEELN